MPAVGELSQALHSTMAITNIATNDETAENRNAVRADRKRTVFPARPSRRHRIKLSALDLPLLTILSAFLQLLVRAIRCGKENNCGNPVHDRCLISPGSPSRLSLELSEAMPPYSQPLLRVKTFRFSKETIKFLKEEANRAFFFTISSFQALCGHVWKAVTRARGLGPDERTSFGLSVNCRNRLVPPLPSEYFGNAIQVIWVTLTAGELERNGISFPAGLLHGLIREHVDEVIRERIDAGQRNPTPIRFENLAKNVLKMGRSPWFRMYENDLGRGEAVDVRSGLANNVDGKANANPGKEGRGSVELEICVASQTMEALETDQCFLSAECFFKL